MKFDNILSLNKLFTELVLSVNDLKNAISTLNKNLIFYWYTPVG